MDWPWSSQLANPQSRHEMAATRLTSTLVLCLLLLLLSSSTATHRRKIRSRRPCKQMVFYFHDILYNGKNAKNATSAIVGAPAWGNRTILAGQNHFGNLVVFDDPITLDNNPHSTRVGRAQGFYLYDRKDYFTAWLGFSLVFNSTQHRPQRKDNICGAWSLEQNKGHLGDWWNWGFLHGSRDSHFDGWCSWGGSLFQAPCWYQVIWVLVTSVLSHSRIVFSYVVHFYVCYHVFFSHDILIFIVFTLFEFKKFW